MRMSGHGEEAFQRRIHGFSVDYRFHRKAFCDTAIEESEAGSMI